MRGFLLSSAYNLANNDLVVSKDRSTNKPYETKLVVIDGTKFAALVYTIPKRIVDVADTNRG